MSADRYEALDALRGVAAAAVVLHHCLLVVPIVERASTGWIVASFPPASPREALLWACLYSPLHLLWDGHAAVLLFFVLSGFVLALPYARGGMPAHGPFVLKRLGRIYLPYLVAMAASAALMALLAHPPAASATIWFYSQWQHPVDWWDVLTLGGKDTHNLDSPAWTLVHELRLSLVFPLIAGLAVVPPAALVLAGLGLLAMGGALPAAAHPAYTLYYAAYFVVGAAIARHHATIATRIQALPRPAKALWLAVALLAASLHWLVPTFVPAARPTALWALWNDGVPALGGAMLVMLAIAPGAFARALAHPAARWLGRISYSLYLVHVVVLLAILHGRPAWLPELAALALVPPASLLVAWGFHRWVEAPAQALGRAVAARWPGQGKVVTAVLSDGPRGGTE